MSIVCFFFKQKTADEMRISYWSSDVCSSDLRAQYPDVEVEIAEGEPRALLRQLRERELDIAFVTGQHDFVDLDSEVMWSESVVLAVARDHHVAPRERHRGSDLRGDRFIVSLQEPGPDRKGDVEGKGVYVRED